ncbi:MAG: BACON domain-containing protein [Synergistaceae bacterium]|nr:BACON domain-containing protein [Synergistaceae bacterium]
MTTKKFLTLSFAVMILFTVIAAGGCGGSGGSDVNIGTTPTPTPEPTPVQSADVIPDMSEILDSPEFEQAYSELEQELRAEGIDPDTYEGPKLHFIMILSDEAVYLDNGLSSASAVRASGVAASETISEMGAKLSADYESGDVIALYFPTPENINKLYEALGERPVYPVTLPEDERTYPEIYAIAKRHGVKAEHYFAYEVQGSKALLLAQITDIISSGDESSSVNSSVDLPVNVSATSEDSSMRQEYLFQSKRYMNFIKWTILLDKRAAELDAGAVSAMAQFKAAADSSANFLDMSSQNFDGDAGYFQKKYQPLYKAQAITPGEDPNALHPFSNYDDALNSNEYMYNLGGYTYPNRIDINYDAGFSFTVYTAHNYSDGDDYYLFKSNAYTTPKNFKQYQTDIDQNWYANWGYTRTFGIKAYVPGASTSEVILRDNAPQTVNRNGSVTDGITTTITGTFGKSQTISGKLGFSGETPTGEIGGEITQSYETSNSVSYSHSQTWETKEWYLYNKSGGNSAEWAADFTDNKTYVQSATVQTKLSSEWIWRVKKDFAVKHSTLDVSVEVKTRQGFDSVRFDGDSSSPLWVQYCDKEITAPKTIHVSRPNQIFVGQRAFSAGKNGGEGMFKLLCNNAYTITSNQAWCQISAEQQKGSGTGANPREIFLWIDTYDSTGAYSTRHATITVTDTVTGDKMEIAVTQRNR